MILLIASVFVLAVMGVSAFVMMVRAEALLKAERDAHAATRAMFRREVVMSVVADPNCPKDRAFLIDTSMMRDPRGSKQRGGR